MKIVYQGLVCSVALCLCQVNVSPSAPQAERWSSPPDVATFPLPSSFPLDDYTPHGYLDNPFHSMVAHRSGVIRTCPPLGIGWWRTDVAGGGYGGGQGDHVNYLSLLQMSLAVGTTAFVTEEDFRRAGCTLRSAYHTCHMISYDWSWGAISTSLRYVLVGEQCLACFVEVTNADSVRREIRIQATHIYRIGERHWWGSDGLTSRYAPTERASISKVWAYGDVFALAGSIPCVAHHCTASSRAWEQWAQSADEPSVDECAVKGRGPQWASQRYLLTVPPGERRGMLVLLSRGANEAAALAELARGFAGAVQSAREQLADDQRFWSSCPQLTGDWPASWRRGWVYDFETLRMTVRRPVGIFTHPWDGMQIHSPRVVLGETSLDMMALGYASPALAREVLFGTFADALAPNVPCAREDGSVNMISMDGSECGTAPMWGYPFHVVRSLFSSSQDTAWLGSLYPHLSGYLHWWLANRTDSAGWLHCNNSWESGQDGSRRFLVAEHNEGAVADFVRTVDVESSVAEACATMELFAGALGKTPEADAWRGLAARRMQNTRSMFYDGWFRDVDGRNGKPILLQGYRDVMMLAPLACGVATKEQTDAVRGTFEYFLSHPSPALEWPPLLFTFAEAAWSAGDQRAASDAVAQASDRVFRRIDVRAIGGHDPDDPFSYRVPGVANEYWPVRDVPPGGENYGWGATLPMLIIRNIIGFREAPGVAADSCFLAPCLPPVLMHPGSSYRISNLKWGRDTLRVTVTCREGNGVAISLVAASPAPSRYVVIEHRTGGVVVDAPAGRGTPVSWKGPNGDVYVLRRVAE